VFTKALARELTRIGQLDSSPETSLDRITALAAQEVPGCAGAGAMIWLGDDVVQSAASHPDVGALLEVQTVLRDGPQWQARQSREPVVIGDTLTEARWPRYGLAALEYGVRSSLAVRLGIGATVLTVGLEAVWPHVFDQPASEWLAVMLAEQLAVALGNAEHYEEAAREAAQMRRALDSWGVISQAKGMLMQAYGCDAATAFDKLRRVSQQSQLKLAEVARRLIEEHAGQAASPAPEAGLSPG
jgi:GAF domain-containing protein